ncbi:MAG: carboxypeptidase-like regulatory domain-containing protein, partial [Gemmatimonadaceae bacterium]|nr:carboxypeptidase-like regulatory domain-containing protein [Chitinophagaceae bacterium]
MHTVKQIIAAIFVLFISSAVLGQSNATGRLSGKVIDSATTQTLAGVSIAQKGSTRGIASISDGSYFLTLPPGNYTIRFSYSGYATKEISGIVIKKGETAFLDIALAQKEDTLTGVVVTATRSREAQSAVYNRQKISAAASDGISQELISKTPDIDGAQ